jgi:hypothetical protein
MLCMVGQKNDAVPAYAFAVPPLPAPALEWDDISAKRIITHLTKPLTDECLLILREPSKVTSGKDLTVLE